MRFSVLLPTRNGARFLPDCIDSILAQDHGDFELVVSDNANEDDTHLVLNRYAQDSRVRVLRQRTPLSVSENWSAAFEASVGDYIAMMGDDDYMLPGFLRRIDTAIERHTSPDCLLYNGYSFVHPEAISGDRRSYWSARHFLFGPEFYGEGELERGHRLSIVSDMFRFRQRIPLNMQTTVFRRAVAAAVRGGVFPPPFPDHYLLNALLISARTWVYLPERLVVVGVSPKSFGHYHYSQNGRQGLNYLGVDTLFPGSLPGNELLNGVCAWLLRLKHFYPAELEKLEIDRSGYVRRQVFSWLQEWRYGGVGTGDFTSRFGLLSARDWTGLATAGLQAESWRYLWRFLTSIGGGKARSLWRGLAPLDNVASIKEFAAWLEVAGEHGRV